MKPNDLLKGINVLDVGIFGVGPFACSFLGRLGADVTRIEPPGIDNTYFVMPQKQDASTIYIVIQANKRNIMLNLKTEAGKEIALRLAKKADIIIQNHQPHVMEKLGLTYEVVRKINPGVIYLSNSGYGHKGPLARTPSADSYQQAMSGFATVSGAPGSSGELLRQSLHIDISCAMGVCSAVFLALLAREKTGVGQKIETSQFEVALSIQSSRIAEYFATGKSPEPMGSANTLIVPSQAFKAYDGTYINVSVPREEYWPKLCRALGLESIEKDPRFATNEKRVENRDELIEILQKKFIDEPARWWLILLRRHDVPCGPYYTYDNIVTDPHVVANRMLEVVNTPWGEVMYTDFPVKFEKVSTVIKPPVKPDSSREEILKEVEYKEK